MPLPPPLLGSLCPTSLSIGCSYAWEQPFAEKVAEIRAKELAALKARKYLDAVCVYLWATTPVLISILTFTTYILLGNKLTAAKVFTSMALFSILIGTYCRQRKPRALTLR